MSSDALRESETVELKKSLAELKQGLVSIVAILNKHQQGELWFGVSPEGKASGLDISEKTLRDVSQAIGAHIEPRIYPRIESITRDNKACLRICFSGQETPYFAHGRAYVRVADEDRQLSARELENLVLTKNRDALRWDNQPLEARYADLSTLDSGKIQRFIERAHLSWEALARSPENALDKLELRKDGQLLNAARLFFAHQPIQLRCAVFATTEAATIIDRHDFDGDILELIEEAQKYILKNIHIGMRIEGLYRVDVPEISMEALREAIINAFCHRDWRDPDYVHVAIFKNRVEIRNPGKLYGGLTIEDLRRGNVSKRRNPLIADLFRRIEMVEAWGRGMPLILENAPSVVFREVAGLFIASFARPSFLQDVAQETTEKPLENHTEAAQKPRRNHREQLLALLKVHPDLNMKELARLSGATLYSVRHHLESLKMAGRIRHVGPSKGGYWEILDNGDEA
jgi:ATP-dependent DNA helicase RecG